MPEIADEPVLLSNGKRVRPSATLHAEVLTDQDATWQSMEAFLRQGTPLTLDLPTGLSGSRWQAPLSVTFDYSDGLFWATNERLSLNASGSTVREALEEFWEELETSLQDFVDCDPDELSTSGLEYRRELETGLASAA
jgi:hypothetical protein